MAITKRLRKTSEKLPKATENFGTPGAPIEKSSPFYFGFLATCGALTAFVLLRSLAAASQIFVLLIISIFLAMGLNPAVEFFRRRGLTRGAAVSAILGIVILFVVILAFLVIPPMVRQSTSLIVSAPALLENLKSNAFINDINTHYGLIDSITQKVKSISSDGTLLISAFGGIVGVGKTFISGIFTALTILVLTMYFTISLPEVMEQAIRLAPASRRPRIKALTDGIVSRIGAFVGSQITVAFIAAQRLNVEPKPIVTNVIRKNYVIYKKPVETKTFIKPDPERDPTVPTTVHTKVRSALFGGQGWGKRAETLRFRESGRFARTSLCRET